MASTMDIQPPTVEQLLAAARATAAKVADWWVATPDSEGRVNLRVVMPLPPAPGEDPWAIWFVTNVNSRKAAEIRRAGHATLACQYHPERSYLVLRGPAFLTQDQKLIADYWRSSWNDYFPGGPETLQIVLVRVVADHIELCLQGITPDPFGIHYASLDRDANGWRTGGEEREIAR